MRITLLAALGAAALLAGCGGDDNDAAPAAGAPTTTIAIKDFTFSPDPATVKAGVAISVPNRDRAPHTLTDMAQPRAFDSGSIDGMDSGKVTFKKAGTYKAFCELHPYMKLTVKVVE